MNLTNANYDPNNRHIVFLYTDLLDRQQVEALVQKQLTHLAETHGYHSNGKFWVTVVTDTKGDGIENRTKCSYLYFTDPAIVAAFYGRNLDFTPRRERIVTRITRAEKEAKDAAAKEAATVATLAQATSAEERIKSMTASGSDNSTASRSSSWADYDDDDDAEFNNPTDVIETITYRDLPPLVPVKFCWPFNEEQRKFLQGKGANKQEAEVEVAVNIPYELTKDHSQSDLCSISPLPVNITEADVKRFFARFTEDNQTIHHFDTKGYRLVPGKKQEPVRTTYPFVRKIDITSKKDGKKRSCFIVRFDPNTRDAYYAVNMGRQARIEKEGKVHNLVFVNCYKSVLQH